MSLVFCQHESESLCIAHIAMVSAVNPQYDYNYGEHKKLGWVTFYDDGQPAEKQEVYDDEI